MKKFVYGLLLLSLAACGTKAPVQPESLPDEEIAPFREAAIKLSPYIVLEDSAFHITIPKSEAIELGVPEKYYLRIEQELEYTNYTISEANRQGQPIAIDTYWTEATPADAESEAAEVIAAVYSKFVFPIDSEGTDRPEDYFTANALTSLQQDYEYDCEDGPCYAFYALRTAEQDSKPGADDESHILTIEPDGNDWYVVSYLDMGWSGMIRIKIVDGKIDEYHRCVADL